VVYLEGAAHRGLHDEECVSEVDTSMSSQRSTLVGENVFSFYLVLLFFLPSPGMPIVHQVKQHASPITVRGMAQHGS
jgi:hypothetical protein